MRKLAILAVLAIGATACGGPAVAPKPVTRSLGGTFVLSDTDSAVRHCQGVGGYRDIAAGVQVTVSDGGGRVLALGALGTGELVPAQETAYSILHPESKSDPVGCTYPISVASIPVADFYGIEVAHRGVQRYSRQDLDEKNWQVHLSLG